MSNSFDSTNGDYRSDTDERGEQKSPERLEREVDQARARLSSTADELSYRLSPGQLVDQALEMAREHGGEFGRNLGSQVKNNPLPMILTSVGLSWLMMSSGKSHPSHVHSSSSLSTGSTGTSRNGSSIKSTLSDTLGKTREKAAEVGDRLHHASDQMHHTRDDMRESAQDFRNTLVQFYREQPLLAGSLGIAIGAALGALVPPTEIEDEAFGEARDRSFDAAKSQAMNKYDEVRSSARPQ